MVMELSLQQLYCSPVAMVMELSLQQLVCSPVAMVFLAVCSIFIVRLSRWSWSCLCSSLFVHLSLWSSWLSAAACLFTCRDGHVRGKYDHDRCGCSRFIVRLSLWSWVVVVMGEQNWPFCFDCGCDKKRMRNHPGSFLFWCGKKNCCKEDVKTTLSC